MARKAPPDMTISAFSEVMNVDRTTLARKITQIKAQPVGKRGGADLYRIFDLVTAFVGGDEKAERIRKIRAESLKLELANRKAKGELVDREATKRQWEKVAASIKIKILNSPMTDQEKDNLLMEIRDSKEDLE